MNADFTKKLLLWNLKQNKRRMPWKGEKDPYKIWLSEIILQQTRVEQGLSYYNSFIKEFPTINHLAKASQNKIFKLWEGLGYYARCRNLIETAHKIVNDYKGKFPASYNEIKELKGVGPYAAAAISSFAYNLPYAVVDGNVIRVLSRYFGISTPVNYSKGKKIYAEIAQSLMPKKSAGIYNQAIMDFGAVICKPRNPLCAECPQKKDCQAFQNGWINILPIKEKVIGKKKRWFYYFILELEQTVYIRQRKTKDIWQNLYEFVLFESNSEINGKELLHSDFILELLGAQKMTITTASSIFKQQLTHQSIRAQFITLRIKKETPELKRQYLAIEKKQLDQFPFPKIITSFLHRITP
jgi:A/G-specific adenine glycosylase